MKDKKSKLNNLSEGEWAEIVSSSNEPNMKRRLFDMGFVPGALVECVQIAPFGDPKAYLIKNTVIALRSEDSEKISVTKK